MDGITDSRDMNLSKLWEMVKDREAWRVAVHWFEKSEPRRVGGLLGVAGRLSGTVSPFRASDSQFL